LELPSDCNAEAERTGVAIRLRQTAEVTHNLKKSGARTARCRAGL